ncbi:GL15054 [Drosophila persimilis]|uniref:GL15054 n=1 Tax=Drosophila persimilis TaxID=7234 RepID=B4GPY4_DROPE|nr:GL15054 [Drosophila persimilis]
MNQLNQFHAPSFGDDAMPTEPPNHASQRQLSLDHSTFINDDEENGDTYGGGGGHSMMKQLEHENQHQMLPQLSPAPQQSQQQPQISVIIHTMWESLDETQKNVYTQRNEQEKRDFVRNMRDYRQQLSETEIPPEIGSSMPDAVASVPAIQTIDLISTETGMSDEQTTSLTQPP